MKSSAKTMRATKHPHGRFREARAAKLLLLIAFGSLLWAPPPSYATIARGAADYVLGQPNLTSATTDYFTTPFGGDFGVTVDTTGRVFVADTSNNRVLWWNAMSEVAADKSPDGVLGEPNLTSTAGGGSQSLLDEPAGIAVDPSGNVWVADQGNHRVLEFSGTLSNGMNASLVLGQPDFTTNTADSDKQGNEASQKDLYSPFDVAVDTAGDVWVADSGNNRVLRFSGTLSSGMNASLVLGEPDFLSGESGGGTSQTLMESPFGVTVDTSGKVWIADTGNNRVLEFSGSLGNGASAKLVLGQSGFSGANGAATQSQMNSPAGVAVDSSGEVWVAEYGNDRLLRFSGVLSNGMNAGLVLGQPNFVSTSTGAAPGQMNGPAGVSLDASGDVWIPDSGNDRVMEFSGTLSNGGAAKVLYPAPYGKGEDEPQGVFVDSLGRLFIADTLNNRVLWWNSSSGLSDGEPPDGVLGQSSLDSVAAGLSQSQMSLPYGVAVDTSGDVWVADYGNSRVLEFTGTLSNGMNASLVLGQTNFTTGACDGDTSGARSTGSDLCDPSGVATASSTIWVADNGNSRVLVYTHTLANDMAATFVLGQPNFTTLSSNSCDSDTNGNNGTPSDLCFPSGVATDAAGHVWVSDEKNSRVLEFAANTTNGMSATLVLGEPDFTSFDVGNGTSQSQLDEPTGVAVDASGDIWVADNGFNRILEFSGHFADGMNATSVLGQSDFTSNGAGTAKNAVDAAYGLTIDASGNIWAADTQNNRTLEYLQNAGNSFALECASTLIVDASGAQSNLMTIQQGLNALPALPWTSDQCIQIEAGTYAESPDIAGIVDFIDGYRLFIFADPLASAGSVIVSASNPGSPMFEVQDDSVTLAGIAFTPSGAVNNVLSLGGRFVQLSSVTVADLSAQSASGIAVDISESSATLSGSTFSCDQAYYCISLDLGSDGASLSKDFVSNALGRGLGLAGSGHASMSQSTVTAVDTAFDPSTSSSGDVITQSYFYSRDGAALGVNGSGIFASSSTFETLDGFGLQDYGEFALSSNTFSNDTFLGDNGGTAASLTEDYGTLIENSVLTASGTAAYPLTVFGSTGAAVVGSTLTGTSLGLWVAHSETFSLTLSTVSTLAGATSLLLDTGNSGALALSSDTFAGGSIGLSIAAPAAAAQLSGTDLRFAGLAAGATAMYFLGGPWISTFTATAFVDAALGVDVNAAALTSPASAISMYGASGTRSGASWDVDPNHVLSWTATQCTGPFSFSFTDPTLSAHQTTLRAVHILDLRTAVAQLRLDAGLSVYTWTDSTLSPHSSVVRAVDVLDLRTALGAVYTACSQSSPAYTDLSLIAHSSTVRLEDITDLRTAVLNAR